MTDKVMHHEHRPAKEFLSVFAPGDSSDWRLVRYQPLLFTALWISVIVLLIFGDFTNAPGDDVGNAFNSMPIVWIVLLLICPPMALLSSWLIIIQHGVWRYRGFLVRLIGDVGVAAAMLAYLIVRFTVGDYHVIPVATLVASTIFTCALVYRDIRTIVQNERLATEIRRVS